MRPTASPPRPLDCAVLPAMVPPGLLARSPPGGSPHTAGEQQPGGVPLLAQLGQNASKFPGCRWMRAMKCTLGDGVGLMADLFQSGPTGGAGGATQANQHGCAARVGWRWAKPVCLLYACQLAATAFTGNNQLTLLCGNVFSICHPAGGWGCRSAWGRCGAEQTPALSGGA